MSALFPAVSRCDTHLWRFGMEQVPLKMAAAKPPTLQVDQEQEAALIAKYGMRPKLSPRLLAKVRRIVCSQT